MLGVKVSMQLYAYKNFIFLNASYLGEICSSVNIELL